MNAVSPSAETAPADATEPVTPRYRRHRRGGLGRRIGLALGLALIALALAAFGYEIWASLQAGAYRTIAAGELWFRLDAGSLNLSQAVIQRYVHPWLWEPAIVTLLRWPAWALLGAPGVVLVLLFSLRRSS